jgi:hypothetical protein
MFIILRADCKIRKSWWDADFGFIGGKGLGCIGYSPHPRNSSFREFGVFH